MNEGNKEVELILSRYSSMLSNEHGILAEGIRYAVELENIQDKRLTIQKLLLYLYTARKIQFENHQREADG